MNQIRKAVRDYLRCGEVWALSSVKHEAALLDFVSFSHNDVRSVLLSSWLWTWATRNKHQRPDEWAARLSIVRGFARPECDGSLDRDTARRSAGLSAAARPALHLYRF